MENITVNPDEKAVETLELNDQEVQETQELLESGDDLDKLDDEFDLEDVEEASEPVQEGDLSYLLGPEDRDDDVTSLEMTWGDLKATIRSGQFSDDDLKAIVDMKAITAEEAAFLVANPIKVSARPKATETETPGKVGKPSKKADKPARSSAQQVMVKNIQDLLIERGEGMTIHQISVALGLLNEDVDVRDPDVKETWKKARGWTRKAVDTHPDGDRSSTDGKNKLYSIIVEADETEESQA